MLGGTDMLDTILHSLTLAGTVAILMLMLREHKIYIRIKDRLNTLWYHHCKEKGDPYTPIDNGKVS